MLDLSFILNSFFDYSTHFVNRVHFRLLGNTNPIIHLLIHSDCLLSSFLESQISPIADLNQSESQDRLFDFDGIFHLFNVRRLLHFFDFFNFFSCLFSRRSFSTFLVASYGLHLSNVRNNLLFKSGLKQLFKSWVVVALNLSGIGTFSDRFNLRHVVAFERKFCRCCTLDLERSLFFY